MNQTETAGFWFGRLTLDALPFYSPVATTGALITLAGALSVIGLLTWKRLWRPLWCIWLTSLDAKRIGIMYVVLAFVMMARGIIEGALMRSQQAVAINANGFLDTDHFAQLFSTHGSIMIFFMAMPFLTGLINFVVPLQIGARDMAFPRLNALSLWLTVGASGLVMASLVLGRFSTGGWTGYPPFTEVDFSPGVGVDYWIWSVTLGSIASTMTGINVAVTIYKLRAPGMHLMRMPLFSWSALCASILMIFAMPPLTVATALLALDRYAGFHFFTNEMGGNMMNYANLFWLFGHPEVYILILPAFGVFSTIFATFSSKRLYGYTSLVYATMVIAVLSFTVWLHHFFTMGQSANLNAVFGIATMTIGIPTGVKIYNWLFTMYRGRIRLTSHMIWAIGFVLLFVIGGLTGILLASPPVDFQVHNTVFLVAHFHNMLIPGMLFGLLAGYQFWFPKAFGFLLDEWWGKVAAYAFILGFCLTFLPLYVTGLGGMTRRTQMLQNGDWQPFMIVSAIGAAVLMAGYAALAVQLWVSIRRRDLYAVPVGDPWNARSLEWSIAAPAPEYNFAVTPSVRERDEFWRRKLDGTAYGQAQEIADIEVPANTAIPFILGMLGAGCAFGLVWQLWWLVVSTLLAFLVVLIFDSFTPAQIRRIAASELEADVAAWRQLVAKTKPVGRGLECDTRNHGLAAGTP